MSNLLLTNLGTAAGEDDNEESEYTVVESRTPSYFMHKPFRCCKCTCPAKCAGARCGQAWYMYLITIIVVLTVILVVCGILMVKPALNATHFKPTHCTVDHSQVLKQMTRCTKLSGKVMHTSRFPCLQIYVRYLGDRNNVHTSLLHDTDIQLAEFPKCSFEFCDGSAWLNEQQVLNFQRLHGRHGQMYKCWFNKDDPEEVILRRRYDDPKVAAFHLIFWPVLLIVLTLIGLYVVYKYYGCKLHWTRL